MRFCPSRLSSNTTGALLLLLFVSLSSSSASAAGREQDYLAQTWLRYRVVYCPEDAGVIPGFEQQIGSLIPNVERMIGVGLRDTVTFVITPTPSEWSRVTGGVPLWAHGIAFPDRGTTILKSPRFGLPYGSLEKTAIHEYVHLLLETGAPQAAYPRWFNEGVAQLAAGQVEFVDQQTVARAAAGGRLLTFWQIESLMGMSERDARLGYAQSVIAVQRLHSQIGWSGIANLVHAVRTGRDFSEAYQSLTGRRLTEFEVECVATIREDYKTTLLGDTDLWFSLALIFLFGFGGVALYLKRKRTLQRWREEDHPTHEPGEPSPPPYTINYEWIRSRNSEDEDENSGKDEASPK